MAKPIINKLDDVQGMVLEFIAATVAKTGLPVKQSQIEDHVTQQGEGPMPFQALEFLMQQGIIENAEGPPNAASAGEPTILFNHWQLTQYGDMVLEHHEANKTKSLAKSEQGQAKDVEPKASNADKGRGRFTAGATGRKQVKVIK